MTRLARVLFVTGGQPGERVAATEAAVAVAVMVLCLGLAVSFSMSILFANDERAHLGYVERLLDGDLPTVDTPILAGPGFEAAGVPYEGDPTTTGPRGDVWVANHPPLVHVVLLPVVWLSLAFDSNMAPAMVIRVASSVAMALGVLAVAAVADVLSPGRPRRAVLVAAVAGLTPMAVAVAGLGQIDGAGFAVGTALLAVILRLLRSGPTAGRLGWLIGLSAMGALTRVSLLPLVGIGAVVWLVSSWGRRRWAVLGSVAAVLVPLAAAGWFYARNVDLYGDIAGAEHLQEKFGRVRTGSTTDLLLRVRLWAGIWQDTWGSFDFGRLGTGGITVGSSQPDLGSRVVIGGVVVVAAVVGGLRRLRHLVPRPARIDVAVWSVGLAWLVVCAVGLASFASGGGTPHPRYLLPAHAVTAALVVGGVTALLSMRVAWPVVLGSLLAVDVLLVSRLRGAVASRVTPDSLSLPGWASAVVVVAVAGAVAAALAAVRFATSDLDAP